VLLLFIIAWGRAHWQTLLLLQVLGCLKVLLRAGLHTGACGFKAY
jgi:hypothetical protein